MRYIGKKSVSSFINVALKVAWWLLLVVLLLFCAVMVFKVFSIDLGDKMSQQIAGLDMSETGQNMLLWFDYSQISTWALGGKIVAMIFFIACGVLRLWILRTVQRLFANLTRDIVFDHKNVRLLSTMSLLLIVSSIINWSFGMLMVSLLMLILCEIFKKGSTLQEEQNLTV
jgi:hypothetical protein